MRRHVLGATNRQVSVIGQGTWYIEQADRRGASAARRNDAFLVSKVLPQNASRRGTVAACEASLKRLKTNRLDCYLLHWRGGGALPGTMQGFRGFGGGGKNRPSG